MRYPKRRWVDGGVVDGEIAGLGNVDNYRRSALRSLKVVGISTPAEMSLHYQKARTRD
jgi:hypothetical protein